jgi:hypothetical protein
MANIQAVSKERHRNKKWMRFTQYSFAAKDAVLPVTAREMTNAIMAMPVGFTPVVIMGIQQGQNLYVSKDGRWLGSYVPAGYRAYPFLMAESQHQQQVVCIDEDSGLVTDYNGEDFFDSSGAPSEAMQGVVDFLGQIARDKENTENMTRLLSKHELIQAWPISLTLDGSDKQVNGLYRVDETRLNALSAGAFEELRQGGALIFAYCQLLSMQHMQLLPLLYETHHKGTGKDVAELDLDFLSDTGTITFN